MVHLFGVKFNLTPEHQILKLFGFMKTLVDTGKTSNSYFKSDCSTGISFFATHVANRKAHVKPC